MKERRGAVAIVVLLVFVAALALLWLLRYTVRDAFLVPILYLFWLGRLVFNSIHQALFWGLLLLVAAILLLTGLRRSPRPGQPGERRMGAQRQNWRVAHWASLAGRASAASSHDIYARSEFRKLIFSVWAYRSHLSPREIEQEIKAGILEPPPELRFYFEDNKDARPPARGALRRAWARLRSRIAGHEPPSMLTTDPHLRLLIESLENELEAET